MWSSNRLNFELYGNYTPLQKKRNTWIKIPHDLILGLATQGVKIEETTLPKTLFCPYGVIDPKIGVMIAPEPSVTFLLEGSVICFSYSVLLDYTYIALGTEGYKVDYIFQFPQIALGF